MFATFLIAAAFLFGGIFLIRHRSRRKADRLAEKHVYAGSFRPTDETVRSLAKTSHASAHPVSGSRRITSSETPRSSFESSDPMPLFFASGAFSPPDSGCDSGSSSWGGGGDSGSSSSCGDGGGSYSSD